MEQLNSVCRLDIMLVFEILDNTRTSMLHPVNVLRNFARLQVRCACTVAAPGSHGLKGQTLDTPCHWIDCTLP